MDLHVVQPGFLVERHVGEADVHAIGRQREIGRDDDPHAVGVDVDGGRRVDGVLHGLQADPAAGIARQRPADDPVVEELLDARRIQDRHHRVDHRELALVRRRRRFARVVVAHQRDHAAPRRGAREVAVTERVAGAVDARPLAVPDGEHAVEVALVAEDVRLLRAPACRRREVLVDARLEVHVVLLQEFRRGRELLVVAAER